MKVPLSTFVAFVSSTGTARWAKVLEAKGIYEPKHDFYKQGREEILDALRRGDLRTLQSLPKRVHSKKASHYKECVIGLQSFLRKNTVTYLRSLAPHEWICGNLQVRVNPELSLRVNDEDFLVKLYLRSERLTAAGKNCLSFLVRELFDMSSATPAILDLRRGTLLPLKPPPRGTKGLVVGEAAAFVAMWDSASAA